MRKLIILMAVLLSSVAMNARTLVAYYSYTNNVERIVNALSLQISCDILEIEPAEKGLNYAANNYAIGSAQIAAIRNNPNSVSSYPAIDPVDVNIEDYDTIIVAVPLWWSQMAAPFQTFLFNYGDRMAGKNIGVIVSSASSGISGVVADAKRLIPNGNFIEPSLWIRSSQTSACDTLIDKWLEDIGYKDLSSGIYSISDDIGFNIVIFDGVLSCKGDFTTLSIYNLDGHKVVETVGQDVGTSMLAPDVYIIQASDGIHSVIRKVRLP